MLCGDCTESMRRRGRGTLPVTSTYPGQRPRVYSHAHRAVTGRAAGADTVHRAGESMGERVCRIVQREVARQTARPRDLLHVDGSKDLDRTVASAVQHSSAAQRVGLSATGPGSHQPSAPERHDHEPSSLIRTGSTLGGGSIRTLIGGGHAARPPRPPGGGPGARRRAVDPLRRLLARPWDAPHRSRVRLHTASAVPTAPRPRVRMSGLTTGCQATPVALYVSRAPSGA